MSCNLAPPSATLRQIATHLVQACCIGSAAVARVIKYVYACLCLVCFLWSGTTRIHNQPWLFFFFHFFTCKKLTYTSSSVFDFFECLNAGHVQLCETQCNSKTWFHDWRTYKSCCVNTLQPFDKIKHRFLFSTQSILEITKMANLPQTHVSSTRFSK